MIHDYKKQYWHRWFAWHPIRINARPECWLFWEWIDRRKNWSNMCSWWEYKFITQEQEVAMRRKP